ncbi:hypothetical protein TpMuguga_03g00272 [Theileria parva strain Muguga]|uniref:uncharacterized protein n=1 Tax=Theileria parva strain Muguga TaxID=333668 RepID=UPI001C616CA7|nr:uncharacterized protein TpMuguga_03g00272 [Theileria parva strain Muguga]KAF5153112.1 hypothetical protein TpMuguga_03g00272 [Theileria parva strain Muguga]
MQICKLLLIFYFIFIKSTVEVKFTRIPSYSLSVSSFYIGQNTTWLLNNKIEPSVTNIIKEELLSQVKNFKPEKSVLSGASDKIDKIALDISEKIAKKKKKFRLKNLFLLEDLKDSSLLTEIFSYFRENPVVYSIWNCNKSILSREEEFVLEIQYKFPIKLKGVPKFYFSPVVTYKITLKPDKYGLTKFSKGLIQLHTHPLMPWKMHNIGSFVLHPPLFNFKNNL